MQRIIDRGVTALSQRRTISKYPNRRLYDPAQGRYITLEDIRALVTGHVEFVVIDKKTGADITCSVLVQVVSCEEKGARSMLRRDFLLDLIRTHSGPEQSSVGAYLERALAVFVKNTALLQQHNVSDTAADEPMVGGPVVTGVPAAVL
jgi:polyhydroxyalkanoate synthesis repressor PhaR